MTETTFPFGRFVLLTQEPAYVTSWDTWEQAKAAFPIPPDHVLLDQATHREWWPGTRYEWEAART